MLIVFATIALSEDLSAVDQKLRIKLANISRDISIFYFISKVNDFLMLHCY